ncbi:unnamed protein product [Triticum turgidum subsp. durum]|uniref:F-box domain-containing protein n=1 Tax=Triticum turgidum subsp. durum TaxID=4567 RepID=A0A9R1B844_TRITD|nr:unnamed protein product [Triticum turgidum subsp. durum]
MASTAAPVAEHRTQLLLTDLGDELLEEVFLRLPTPAELARACTARASFRRIITERSFLRSYRKRHPPPLLGFVGEEGGFHPAQAPHPSAPLARALADAADFTYSFVPQHDEGHVWVPCDARDGRVLLEDGQIWEAFRHLAVCDPLFRGYALLPPVPGNLALQEKGRPVTNSLMPIAEDEDETLFKVICLANYETKLVAFLFSSVTGEWCIAATVSWSSLGSQPQIWRNFRGCDYRGVSCFDCARGSYYSTSTFNDKLLVLDTRKMEFCTVDDRTGYHMNLRCLPGQHEDVVDIYVPSRFRPGQSRSLPRIVVGREGALEMFSLVGDHTPNGSFDLYHTTQQNNGQSSKEWQLENIIPLPGKYDYFTVGAAEGFLFLGATTEDQLDFVESVPMSLLTTEWNVDYFALDVKTSELTKVCRSRRQFFHNEDVHCYFGFPLSLSKPSI